MENLTLIHALEKSFIYALTNFILFFPLGYPGSLIPVQAKVSQTNPSQKLTHIDHELN